MAGADDVVKAALKLIAGGSDDAAKRIASIRRSEPFPADYIEPGSVRYRYEHPDTSSFMEIITRPKGARSASVIGLEVPEEYRGTGIGKALQERVLQDYPSLMGQVSSKAAAVNAYKAGRRPLANPNATLEDVFKMIDEDSSVNLATPKNTGGRIAKGPGGWVDDVVKMAGKAIMGGDEKVAPVSRIGMNYKDVTKRVPELTEAAKRLQSGEIGQSEYSAMVDRFKPVEPYASVPNPASVEDMVRALTANKREKIGKLADYPEGHPVALRLDIPAYTAHGVWVPTIHDQKTFKSISHEPAAHITGAQFSIPENKALAVAAGGAKGPFATIDGSLLKTPPEAIHERAKAAMNDPDWVQVGMDPERHSYFYDRKTMQPVLSAEEVIQVGPLVLARKPVYGNAEGFKYSKGGSARYGNNSISGALNVARGLNGGE